MRIFSHRTFAEPRATIPLHLQLEHVLQTDVDSGCHFILPHVYLFVGEQNPQRAVLFQLTRWSNPFSFGPILWTKSLTDRNICSLPVLVSFRIKLCPRVDPNQTPRATFWQVSQIWWFRFHVWVSASVLIFGGPRYEVWPLWKRSASGYTFQNKTKATPAANTVDVFNRLQNNKEINKFIVVVKIQTNYIFCWAVFHIVCFVHIVYALWYYHIHIIIIIHDS